MVTVIDTKTNHQLYELTTALNTPPTKHNLNTRNYAREKEREVY